MGELAPAASRTAARTLRDRELPGDAGRPLTTVAPIRRRPPQVSTQARERPSPTAERGPRDDEPRTAAPRPHCRPRARTPQRTGALAAAERQHNPKGVSSSGNEAHGLLSSSTSTGALAPLIASERSPLQTARLLPGDCLYLPAGFWHMARSIEDSLSMSLGVYPAAERRSA